MRNCMMHFFQRSASIVCSRHLRENLLLRAPDGELAKAPADIRDYCEKRVVRLLRENATVNRSTWTNNNCESINHVLKQAVQWRPNHIPDLIDKLRRLVDDTDRALCGRGDFVLRPEYAHHRY